MFDKVTTLEEYYSCLYQSRLNSWKDLLQLEKDGMKDTPDYHRTISRWATYDRAICLLEELMSHMNEED